MDYDLTSAKNPRVRHLAKLRDSAHRHEHGQFVVEGERLVRRAIASGMTPVEAFATSNLEWIGVTTVKPAVLDGVSYRKRSENLLAVFNSIETDIEDLNQIGEGVVLVAENIEKPGNLGAMLRTASAAGCRAVVTIGSVVDIHNPNTIRSSTGAVFDLPVIHTDWNSVAGWADGAGFSTVGAVVGDGVPFWDLDLSGSTAIVIGAEDTGLSPKVASRVSQLANIPQETGAVDSLNASVAAGILLFEAVRQRR